jgi:MFS family permease
MSGATVADPPAHAKAPAGVLVTLLPLMAVMFIAFLVIGLAMPVLPLYVHRGLGLGTFVVGLVAGSQFAVAFVSRFGSGDYADRRGGKRAVVIGLLMAAAAGLFYLVSLRFAGRPVTSVAILLAGRGILGGAESFIITGSLSLGLAMAGQRNAGKVMSWLGTAMYAAYAVGAPLGTTLYAAYGFLSIALATLVIPLLALLIIAPVPPVAAQAQVRPGFREVANAVWLPGLGLALCSVGFGAITTFVSLLFADRGWGLTWVAFTSVSVGFILGRVAFGHLPDRIGGSRVALACVVIEAAGQALIWLAPSAALVFIGAALTGIGYSLVYPAFGVEAVRRAPPMSRGLVMGAYTAFLDLALGVANPALGLLAGHAGLRSVFLASTVVVLCASAIAIRLLRAPSSA